VGARGYVLKSQAARDLVQAIERVLAGGTFSIASQETERGNAVPRAAYKLQG
jgi:DNA-binding NarL/FixJ family response regulator